MKKVYETPSVEVVEFKYRDQVVVASSGCYWVWVNTSPSGGSQCETTPSLQSVNN